MALISANDVSKLVMIIYSKRSANTGYTNFACNLEWLQDKKEVEVTFVTKVFDVFSAISLRDLDAPYHFKIFSKKSPKIQRHLVNKINVKKYTHTVKYSVMQEDITMEERKQSKLIFDKIINHSVWSTSWIYDTDFSSPYFNSYEEFEKFIDDLNYKEHFVPISVVTSKGKVYDFRERVSRVLIDYQWAPIQWLIPPPKRMAPKKPKQKLQYERRRYFNLKKDTKYRISIVKVPRDYLGYTCYQNQFRIKNVNSIKSKSEIVIDEQIKIGNLKDEFIKLIDLFRKFKLWFADQNFTINIMKMRNDLLYIESIKTSMYLKVIQSFC
jgi:hypothetical protein